MHATPISTNTRKYIIFGKSFYIQTPELKNPKLADIKGLKDKILNFWFIYFMIYMIYAMITFYFILFLNLKPLQDDRFGKFWFITLK